MVSDFAIIFSHIIPPIMGFVGILLMCTGIMDKNNQYTLAGIVIFFAGSLTLLYIAISSVLIRNIVKYNFV